MLRCGVQLCIYSMIPETTNVDQEYAGQIIIDLNMRYRVVGFLAAAYARVLGRGDRDRSFDCVVMTINEEIINDSGH